MYLIQRIWITDENKIIRKKIIECASTSFWTKDNELTIRLGTASCNRQQGCQYCKWIYRVCTQTWRWKQHAASKRRDIHWITQCQLSYLMFCWPCIIVYQYNETNAMHFSFNLLRIKGLYMFRALLAHLQEALHKRRLVYCVRVMSVGCCCYQDWSGTKFHSNTGSKMSK
jgi:hypothetical protein